MYIFNIIIIKFPDVMDNCIFDNVAECGCEC